MIQLEFARTIITGVCIALAAACVLYLYRNSETETPAPIATPLRYRQIAAADVYRAYEGGISAADRRFRNVHWSVSGTIAEVSTDQAGTPILVLEPGIECELPRSSAHQVESLSAGKKIELRCMGKGKRNRPLMECTLQ